MANGGHVNPEPFSTDSIRLLGVDCPESRQVSKCGKWKPCLSRDDEVKLGKAATRRMRELAPEWSEFTIEIHKIDRYGRLLAYVTLEDGRDLGLTMLKWIRTT